jgi:hypothetical protein
LQLVVALFLLGVSCAASSSAATGPDIDKLAGQPADIAPSAYQYRADRKPPGEVRLRLRHPKSAPIKSVTVNGKAWNDFDPGKEIVKLHGMKDTAIIDVNY